MNSSDYYPLKVGKAASETSFSINFFVLLVGILFLVLCRFLGFHNNTYLFIGFALILTVGIVGLEFLFYPQKAFPKQWKIRRLPDWKRIFYKENGQFCSSKKS